MDIQTDEPTILAPAIASRQDARELIRTVVAVLVRVVMPVERFAGSLVGVLPVTAIAEIPQARSSKFPS